MERQPGRSAAVAQFGRVGCLGASQSFGLRRQASWLKVWRGAGCNFSATERAHKRNGGQVDAEWRRPGLVTTSGTQQNCTMNITPPKNFTPGRGVATLCLLSRSEEHT